MPKFNANLLFMFQEYALLDRYDAASRAKFNAVEFQFPYETTVEAIAEKLEQNDLQHILVNLPGVDPDTGLDNITIRPDRRDLFKERLTMAVEYASGLGCSVANIIVGERHEGADEEEMREVVVENLRLAAEELGKIGVKALTEPINTNEKPNFYIPTTQKAVELINEVNHPNLGLLYDVYHAQVMEGNLAATIKANLPLIWHIQFADNPSRSEPETGEINFDFLFAYLDQIGYEGWVGCEYTPAGRTEDGLGWRRKWL